MRDVNEKRYLSVSDVMESAVKLARTDPRFAEAEKNCPLDYDLLCSSVKYDKLHCCDFDVIGDVVYGSSEGIYGDIYLYGSWNKDMKDEPFRSRMRVYSLKTLEASKEAYIGMGMLVTLICYYANEFIRTHLDRFD